MQQRFVISLTSLPNRHKSLKDNLEALLRQNYSNYEIHLNLPTVSPLNGEWSDLDLPTDDKLKVYWVEDVGAVTKLYYTIQRTNDRVVTVDDDFIYHPEMLNEYNYLTQLLPDSALGFAGIYPTDMQTDGELHCIGCLQSDVYVKVGVLEGYKSVCYRPEWFDDEFLTQWHKQHYNDDLMISSWLGYKGIDKCVIPYSDETNYTNRNISFPLITPLSNPASGQDHFRKHDGGSAVSYKAFYNNPNLGKYIQR